MDAPLDLSLLPLPRAAAAAAGLEGGGEEAAMLMAKSGGGRLSKLKCMIKRWHSSSGRLARTAPASAAAAAAAPAGGSGWTHSASFRGSDEAPPGLHAVYVGKSLRRYLVSEELAGHPLFRVLVERSASGAGAGPGGGTVVDCEVVLFEHLLWMLEDAETPAESLDELAEFYAC